MINYSDIAVYCELLVRKILAMFWIVVFIGGFVINHHVLKFG